MIPAAGPSGLWGWLFWTAALFVAYTYFLYPLLVTLVARLRPRPVRWRADCRPSISVVLATHNEAANLARRLENLLAQDYPTDRVEVIVVSDGSTDDTEPLLDAWQRREARVRALALDRNRGKAAALNAGVAAARGELIVFADARQTFAPDVLARLAENFADERVGSVSGELLLTEDEAGVAAQVGLYWRYEKWIRRSESAAGSMLGATGAIYAIRRALWRPLPEGTLLDDFLTPMRIVLAGWRATFDGRAVAFDRASAKAGQEFRRKVRTLAGNFQAFALEPGLLLPWRNPATWFQVWSHKVFRLLVPYALAAMLLASLLAAGSLYGALAALQALFYGLALAAWQLERTGRPLRWRLASLSYTFVTLNVAAAWGLWTWLRGRGAGQVWRKAYQEPPLASRKP